MALISSDLTVARGMYQAERSRRFLHSILLKTPGLPLSLSILDGKADLFTVLTLKEPGYGLLTTSLTEMVGHKLHSSVDVEFSQKVADLSG
jgi:hypothetical protein